ncbi:MAG: hypothetical protein IJG56_03860 [Clostridia bacterium]|nr:hypothetical protein [Clostridia bacterium]
MPRFERSPAPYRGKRREQGLRRLISFLVGLALVMLLVIWLVNSPLWERITHRGQEESAGSEVTEEQGQTSSSEGAGEPQTGEKDLPSEETDSQKESTLPVDPAKVLAAGKYFAVLSREDTASLEEAVQRAVAQGADGIMVDLKQSGGEILYRSSLGEEAVVKALSSDPYSLEELSALCWQHDLLLIGRMSTFSDSLAASHIAGSYLTVESGVAFLDGYNKRNLDPYREAALAYLTRLAEEAAPYLDGMILSDLTFPSYGKPYLIALPQSPDKGSQLLFCAQELARVVSQQGAAVWIELPVRALTDASYASVSGQTYLLALSESERPLPVVLKLSGAETDDTVARLMGLLPESLTVIVEHTLKESSAEDLARFPGAAALLCPLQAS